jgi:type VI secretion system protein ImpF
MPGDAAPEGLMPSILDRLIDPDAGGTRWKRGYSLTEMVDAVRRDLEDLLNTRQSHLGLPKEYTELHNSIFAYGLPELTSLNSFTTVQRAEIGRVIEAIVARFEPRLRNIRANLIDPGDEKSRSVRFRIDARLSVEPAPEVAFETTLELGTGRYSIQQAES